MVIHGVVLRNWETRRAEAPVQRELGGFT